MIDRRTFTLGAASLAAALPALLAGCSSETSSEESTAEETSADDATASDEGGATSYPLTLTIYDAEGSEVEVTYEQAPERIVSTQLSITELLLTLDLKDRIVGIMDNDNAVDDDLQAELDDLTSLGYKNSISREAILAAEPDIVLGKSTRMFTDDAIGTVEDYLDLGIPVYTQLASVDAIDQTGLTNIIQDVRNIGAIFDVQDAANAYADELEERLEATIEAVSDATDDDDQKSVILMAGYQDGTFLTYSSVFNSAMLEAVNAVNVGSSGSGFTLENLISLNPDAIIYVTTDRYADTDTDVIDTLLAEESIQDVTAIADAAITTIPYDDVMDYGARCIDTLGVLAEFLHGVSV